VPKSTTFDDLERPIRTLLQKRCVFGSPPQITIDPHYQRQKCRPTTLVSGGIRLKRIFAEVPRKGGVKRQWSCQQRQFSAFSLSVCTGGLWSSRRYMAGRNKIRNLESKWCHTHLEQLWRGARLRMPRIHGRINESVSLASVMSNPLSAVWPVPCHTARRRKQNGVKNLPEVATRQYPQWGGGIGGYNAVL